MSDLTLPSELRRRAVKSRSLSAKSHLIGLHLPAERYAQTVIAYRTTAVVWDLLELANVLDVVDMKNLRQ